MKMLGMVVLNYLTYDDTYDLIKSLNIKNNNKLVIYVVDNKTDIEQYERLKKALRELTLRFKLVFLSSAENLGFAKGMNVGIKKAKKDGCNFIICSNNDVVFSEDVDFNQLIKLHSHDDNIAVIGPKILNSDMFDQNPYMVSSPFNNEYVNKIRKIILFSFLGKYLFFMRGCLRGVFSKTNFRLESVDSSNYVYCLHGSFFMLTPSYFRYYENLDENTFLFVEELILSERVKNKGLKEYYYSDMVIIHKEDSSTNKMLGKGIRKRMFILNENYKSFKYFMNEYMK